MNCPICFNVFGIIVSPFTVKDMKDYTNLKYIKCNRCKSETILDEETSNPLLTKLHNNTILIDFQRKNITHLFKRHKNKHIIKLFKIALNLNLIEGTYR